MAHRWHQITRWLQPLKIVIIMFIVSRVMLLMGGYVAVAAAKPDLGEAWTTPYKLDVWANWDGRWYIRIVTEGYSYKGQSDQGSIAFYPLYPILMRGVMPLVGHNPTLAGMLISHACLLGALILLYHLTLLETRDSATARRAVFYLLIAPASFFFSAVYTESLFLLCSLGAFYAMRRRWWGWAILGALLASVTRVVGILLWGVLLWELARALWSDYQAAHVLDKADKHTSFLPERRPIMLFYGLVAACTLLIPLGLVSFMLYNAAAFGDASAFNKAQAGWGRTGFFSPNLFYELRQFFRADWTQANLDFKSILSLVTIFGGAALIIPIGRKWGVSYGGYTFAAWLIPILSSTIYSQSLLRYATVLFPFFMLLAVWGRREWVDRTITLCFALSQGVLMSLFVTGIFVG